MTKELPIQWSIEKRKIKDLYAYAQNPRKCTKKTASEIKESLEKFGQCEVIVINPDGLIIGGHQRVSVLKKMGTKEASVSVPSRYLDEKEIQELNVKLNKIDSDWDDDILANVCDPIDLVEWGFSLKEVGIDYNDEDTTKATKDKKKKECPHCGGEI